MENPETQPKPHAAATCGVLPKYNHTPQPWEVRAIGIGTETEHSAYAIFETGASEAAGRICHIPQSATKPTRANAMLISTAPLLLETVKYALICATNDREEALRHHSNAEEDLDEDAAFIIAGLDADIALYKQAIALATRRSES